MIAMLIWSRRLSARRRSCMVEQVGFSSLLSSWSGFRAERRWALVAEGALSTIGRSRRGYRNLVRGEVGCERSESRVVRRIPADRYLVCQAGRWLSRLGLQRRADLARPNNASTETGHLPARRSRRSHQNELEALYQMLHRIRPGRYAAA